MKRPSGSAGGSDPPLGFSSITPSMGSPDRILEVGFVAMVDQSICYDSLQLLRVDPTRQNEMAVFEG